MPVRVVGPAELPLAFMELISNRRSALRWAAEEQKLCARKWGATQRTMQALENLLTPAANAQSRND